MERDGCMRSLIWLPYRGLSLLFRKIHNVSRKIIQLWAPKSIKGAVWDREFRRGRWDHLDHTEKDIIYSYIEKYCDNGNILDLGCGSGNTSNEINIEGYGRYTGIDISNVAIEKAISRSKQNNRSHKNEFCVADISAYIPIETYDLILFRECLFYFPKSKIKSILDKYKKNLSSKGVFVVRFAAIEKYAYIQTIIENSYEIIEKCLHEHDDGKTIVMVFR